MLLTYVFFTLYPLAVVASAIVRALLAPRHRRLREIGEPARKALIVDLVRPARAGARSVSTTRCAASPWRARPRSAARSGRSGRRSRSRRRRARRSRHALGRPGSCRPTIRGRRRMKWVTRKRIHVNRTATGWLIRRFLDPAPRSSSSSPARSPGSGARGRRRLRRSRRPYPHEDALGRCSFEQLVAERLASIRRSRVSRGSSTAPTSPSRSTHSGVGGALGDQPGLHGRRAPTTARSWIAPAFSTTLCSNTVLYIYWLGWSCYRES